MYTTLLVLMIIVAVLLILIVLIQNPKGGGISGEISGGNRMFGVQQTGDLLEKITWGAATFIFVAAILSKVLLGGQASTTIESANINEAQTKTTAPALPAPAASTAATTATDTTKK